MRLLAPTVPLLVALLCGLCPAQQANQRDPSVVAKAYLDACQKWDAEAAGKVVVSKQQAAALIKVTNEPHASQIDQVLTEALCAPLTRHATYAMGEVVTNGDECRVRVVATYTVPETLVLRRGPDGEWKVDLKETILSSTGADAPLIFGAALASEQAECLSNLKQLCLAFLMYAQDHDETLPKAEHWCDDIMLYLKNEQALTCPQAPELKCAYAFNKELSGKKLAQIDEPSQAIVLFDCNLGTKNAAGAPADMARPGRHDGGDNVGYVDGHCKWLKVD